MKPACCLILMQTLQNKCEPTENSCSDWLFLLAYSVKLETLMPYFYLCNMFKHIVVGIYD